MSSSDAKTVIETDPLSRIRSEFPEFCSFLSTARRMANDPNDVESVLDAVKRMVGTLLIHDQKEIEPNVFERAGVDRLLFAIDSCSESYASEIEMKTKRIRDACTEFERAVTEMERLKSRVLGAYADSMREFDEILRMGTEMTLNPSVLTEMLDPRGTERRTSFVSSRPPSPFSQLPEEDSVSHGDLTHVPPSPFASRNDKESGEEEEDDSLSLGSMLGEIMEDWFNEDEGGAKSPGEEEEKPVEAAAEETPLLIPDNSPEELESFFEQNNTPIITGDVDASTRAPIVSIEVEKIEKRIEKEEAEKKPQKKKKASKRKREPAPSSSDEVTIT